MVPEPVGAEALLVHKTIRGLDVLDLGDPPPATESRQADAVLNDQPVLHDLRHLGDDLEPQPWRGDGVEVGRGLDKRPRLFKGGGKELALP